MKKSDIESLLYSINSDAFWWIPPNPDIAEGVLQALQIVNNYFEVLGIEDSRYPILRDKWYRRISEAKNGQTDL